MNKTYYVVQVLGPAICTDGLTTGTEDYDSTVTRMRELARQTPGLKFGIVSLERTCIVSGLTEERADP